MEDRVRQPQLEGMMTAQQVSDFLGVSVHSLRRWCKSGALKAYRVGAARQMRFRRHDVLRFLEESNANTPPDARTVGTGGSLEGDRTVGLDSPVTTPDQASPFTARTGGSGKRMLMTSTEAMPEVLALLDENLDFTGISPAGEQALGLPENAVVGRNILDFAPHLKDTGRYSAYSEIARDGGFSIIDHLDLHTEAGTVRLNVSVLKIGDRLAIAGSVNPARRRGRPAEEALLASV